MASNRIHRIGWIVIVALAFPFVTGVIVAHSRPFHRYLLAAMVSQAQKAIGGRVEIGDFSIHVLGRRVDFYRVAIHGAEREPQSPLLWADHLGVTLKIVSLWRHQISLQKIEVDHPVVHLRVDRNGRTNVPQTSAASQGQSTNVFDLAIGHCVVTGGEFFLNDRQTHLNTDLRDLQTQISFDPLKRVYLGRIGYKYGGLQFGAEGPLLHSLDARFSASASGLTVNYLNIASGSSRITAHAQLENYGNPNVEGSYHMVLFTGEFKDLLRNSSFPIGELWTRGTFNLRPEHDQPLLNTLSVRGALGSPSLSVDLPQARTDVRALTGEYDLEKGTLLAKNVRANILGGRVTAQLTMQHLADSPGTHVAAELRDISLPDTVTALRIKPGIRILGHLDGKINAAWRGSLEDLQIRSVATVGASTKVPAAVGTGANSIPVNGAAEVAYNGRAGRVSVRQTWLRTPHTALNLDGSIGDRSALGLQAKSDDLREIDALLLAIRAATSSRAAAASSPPQMLGLGGSAAFSGELLGRLNHVRLTGHFSAANLHFKDKSAPSLSTNVDLSPSGVALRQAEIRTGAQGRVQFDAEVELKDWAYAAQNQVSLHLSANNVLVAEVQRVAGVHYPISGVLSANLSVHGSQLNPAGQGSVRLSRAKAWGQTVQQLSIEFQGAQNAVRTALNLRTPSGSMSAKVAYSLDNEQYDLQVDVPELRLGQLEPVRSRHLPVSGIVTASALGRGTLKSPQLGVTIEAPRLQVREQKLDGLKIRAGVAQGRVTFLVDSKVEGGYVQAHGAVNLDPDLNAMVNIETRRFALTPLLAAYFPERGTELRGQTELHGWLKGPLKHPERLEAHIEIPTFSLGYRALQIANVSPIRIDYRSGNVALESVELKGTDSDLQLEAVVPREADGALHAAVTGNVDLQILQLFDPQLDSSGQVKFDARAQGTRTHPEFRGSLQIINAALQSSESPLGAEKINAQFEAQKDRIEIKSFTAETGGGMVSANGYVAFQPEVRFNIGLSAKKVRLRYPEGLRAELDSNLALNGTSRASLLSGDVLINSVSFTKAFDLATFADQFSGPSTPPSEGFAQNVKLNVGLRSTSDMGLSSSEVSVQGSTDLRVAGTAAEPVILGRTNFTGGEMFFRDRRYELQNGVIQFVNPVRTEPVVNATVTTVVDQFNITLNFVGPLDRLRTTYSSDPPLPAVDIINLLVSGHTTEAASTYPTTPQSVVAGQLAGQVGNRVGKMAGMSSLKIDPQIGGNGSNPGAVVAVQQRVTKNLFFTFGTDVTTTQGVVVQVEYQLTPKYSVSSVRDQNGGYSLQIKMHKKF